MMLVLAPPGAVPVVGGSSDPSVPRSPGVSPQKAQGGPWAPPPCSVNCSETLSGCVCFSVRFSGMDVGYSVWFFSVSGVGIMLLGLVPFRTCPLLAEVFVVLFFLWMFGWFRRRRSLSFFLSQVLGKPKPLFGGLGFP